MARKSQASAKADQADLKGQRALVRKNEWSEDSKKKAIEAYFLVGSLPKAAAVTGVPITTIRSWLHHPALQPAVQQFGVQRAKEASTRAGSLFQDALDVVEDRLANGDERISPLGTVIRVGVSGRDAAQIAESLAKDVKLWTDIAYGSAQAPLDITPESHERLARVMLEAEQELRRRGEPIEVEVTQVSQDPGGSPAHHPRKAGLVPATDPAPTRGGSDAGLLEAEESKDNQDQPRKRDED